MSKVPGALKRFSGGAHPFLISGCHHDASAPTTETTLKLSPPPYDPLASPPQASYDLTSLSQDAAAEARSRRRYAVVGALIGGIVVAALAVILWAFGSSDRDGEVAEPVATEAVAESPATEPVTSAPAPPTTVTAPTTVAPPQVTTTPPPTPRTSAAPSVDADTGLTAFDASAIGAAVVPSVVTVQVGSSGANGLAISATGSGVVVDVEGYVVTNNHVVAAGTAYEVILADGRVYEASLVGADPATDLAVLSITAEGLAAIEFGSTDDLTVGDPAVAIGSPLGLRGGPSLTVGVVSAFGREVRTNPTVTLYGMVQTDAPITNGSSGGALVGASGRLIGITTAVGVSEAGIEGIGFATPVEIVSRVVGELITKNEASQPFLGITGSTGFRDTADGGRVPTGVDVGSVEPGSGASAAGVEPGDVITALNDHPIDTMDELIALLRRFSAGETVELTVLHGEATVVLETILGNR